MNNAVKGALVSGLVFPGLGQIMLKHYKRGTVLILAVSAGLLVILVKVVGHALTILEKLESEGGSIDLGSISQAATQASTASESLTVKLLMVLIVGCWIIGVVDAFWIGRKKDLEARLAGPAALGKNG